MIILHLREIPKSHIKVVPRVENGAVGARHRLDGFQVRNVVPRIPSVRAPLGATRPRQSYQE